MSLIGQGESVAAAARLSGLSKSWVAEVVGRYNAQGPAGVEDGHRRKAGAPAPLLDAAGQAALAATLAAPVAEALGGGRWSGRKVAAWVSRPTPVAAPSIPSRAGWG